MAVSGNKITIAQDGGPAKLHPYLIALVRWCVSCLWSTATVLLHRVLIKPVPQITGTNVKLSKPRPAGREHLHPEPKVECVVLHQPEVHNLDVIFVHGLYGSLCNTWRQDKECEVGCGCNCDDCYSPCWPKDWIKVDYPEARVISINYTSDPHLWRPIWIKENKRLCLHERAEQMTEQLLDLGVGDRPVIWVGHSKGGLFIKQIYCEAYEAYLKTHPDHERNTSQDITSQEINDITVSIITENENDNNKEKESKEQNINDNYVYEKTNSEQNICNSQLDLRDSNINNNLEENKKSTILRIKCLQQKSNEYQQQCFDTKVDQLKRRASLWENSGAFMFYSVPHRGSPLADIKIPIAARSIELMEISKDNSLVLSLQERWLRATASSKPLVRSLVETRRTLMSVLWLRIVSTDSADPGMGALCGVSVDHREICKPSSRHCLLYTELAALIKAGLDKFKPTAS
ncbi:hypothetical protein O0L34_g4928 [Tuta absoluta]|nr:hypothetical protein O0L34_g4928 [Tuta absoluta]